MRWDAASLERAEGASIRACLAVWGALGAAALLGATFPPVLLRLGLLPFVVPALLAIGQRRRRWAGLGALLITVGVSVRAAGPRGDGETMAGYVLQLAGLTLHLWAAFHERPATRGGRWRSRRRRDRRATDLATSPTA